MGCGNSKQLNHTFTEPVKKSKIKNSCLKISSPEGSNFIQNKKKNFEKIKKEPKKSNQAQSSQKRTAKTLQKSSSPMSKQPISLR